MPAATATLLEDSAVNIDQWLAGEVEMAFAVQEGAAFVNGDGTNKPTGFLHQTIVAESSWMWGKLGYVATGAAGAFDGDAPTDALIDLVYALKAGYRQNGTFVVNRKTQSALRKLKDDDGQYLWQPPTQGGGRSTLLNFPVVEAEDMPDIAADAYALAFGDFARGYLVVDRAGVRVLREVAATQRAEIASEDILQRWWRPIFALELSLIECPAFSVTLLHALWTGFEPAISGFGNLSGLLMAYFGARFGILGIYVNGRNKQKLTLANGGTVPGVIAELSKVLLKKK